MRFRSIDLRSVLLYFSAFLIFLTSAIYITYPLALHLGDLVTGHGDELVIAWIHNWVIHALTTDPLSMFGANTYYPYTNVLAYSDLFFTSSILAMLPLALIGEPIAAFNFTLLSSLVLTGFSLFLLSYYLTKDYAASALSGLLFIFSPAVLDKKIHVQVLALQWIPLSILCFLLFTKTKKLRYLIGSMIFFLLQTYNSFLPGYFLVAFFSIYVVYVWIVKRKTLMQLISKKSITVVTVTFFLLLPIVIPYYRVSQEFNAVRDIRDAIHFALQPEDLYFPNEHTRLQGPLLALSAPEENSGGFFKPGYIGLVFSILAVVAIVYSFKKFQKKNTAFNVLIITGLTGLLLSLGPALHLGRATVHHPSPIPLPYALFYYILPGFQGFRNSARWEMLFIVCMAIAISIVLVSLLKRFDQTKRVCIYALLIVGVVIEYNFPMRFIPVPQRSEFPEVYHWLSTTPSDSSVIILPAYNWDSPFSGDEIMRQYYLIAHFRRIVNGYSGFSPPPWQDLLATLQQDFPDDATLKHLHDLGVDYIVIDEEGYDKSFANHWVKADGESVIAYLSAHQSIEFDQQLGGHTVFRFTSK